MSFFRELLESLGLRKRTAPQIGLRPHRDVVVPLGVDAAQDRVLEALVRTLGANVNLDDRTAHVIEAGFGLVNAERVRVSLESEDASQTIVHIEAQYRAGLERPPSSRNVDALAEALR
ncbi:MAG TPA: hypothetical protein VF741_01550 [Candidatus Aquilonibacter sp.]